MVGFTRKQDRNFRIDAARRISQAHGHGNLADKIAARGDYAGGRINGEVVIGLRQVIILVVVVVVPNGQIDAQRKRVADFRLVFLHIDGHRLGVKPKRRGTEKNRRRVRQGDDNRVVDRNRPEQGQVVFNRLFCFHNQLQ